MSKAKTTSGLFLQYWKDYGGVRSLLRSRYLQSAFVISLISFNLWSQPNCVQSGDCNYWWDLSISVLPNLLGFTLGGFAIFVGFGDERFLSILTKPGRVSRVRTVYSEVCAGFLHFIIIQVSALLFALISKSTWFYSEWMDCFSDYLVYLNLTAGFFGFFLFLYSITSIVAAAMLIYRITTWYTFHQQKLMREKNQTEISDRACREKLKRINLKNRIGARK